ncbi:PaaI family thioesterase [Lacihabitans sp. LS3-19]|uniref:PaaI family thioesterase n=1 Tax=Lacihabitans sp. LS3-19 TaxID=2487335 RepID=UPI0020CC3D31|nr:PaaI family thioesterase [Lacihabitans sp. LS3-19]MCP9767955.1 PaaI family thioesterase [Lacihabitans sp. LS3-19]
MFKELIGKQAKDSSPSPFGRWLNGTLLEAKVGSITVEFEIREELTNPGGIMHGGAIAAIIDEVIGMTTFSLGKPGFYVAINLNIDFLRPGLKGEKIKAVSEVIRDGKTMAHAECKIFNQEGKLIAKAASNLVMTNIPKA